MLIVGSFVPWIYYAFYCRTLPKTIYMTMIIVLGFMALIVALWDRFATPKLRPVRAGVFVMMGLSSKLNYVTLKSIVNISLTLYNTIYYRCCPGYALGYH